MHEKQVALSGYRFDHMKFRSMRRPAVSNLKDLRRQPQPTGPWRRHVSPVLLGSRAEIARHAFLHGVARSGSPRFRPTRTTDSPPCFAPLIDAAPS